MKFSKLSVLAVCALLPSAAYGDVIDHDINCPQGKCLDMGEFAEVHSPCPQGVCLEPTVVVPEVGDDGIAATGGIRHDVHKVHKDVKKHYRHHGGGSVHGFVVKGHHNRRLDKMDWVEQSAEFASDWTEAWVGDANPYTTTAKGRVHAFEIEPEVRNLRGLQDVVDEIKDDVKDTVEDVKEDVEDAVTGNIEPGVDADVDPGLGKDVDVDPGFNVVGDANPNATAANGTDFPDHEHAFSFDLEGLPKDCTTCAIAITDATECTEEAVTASNGVWSPVTTDAEGAVFGTLTFDQAINANLKPGGLVGKTVVFGFTNGTAVACSVIGDTRDTTTSTNGDGTGPGTEAATDPDTDTDGAAQTSSAASKGSFLAGAAAAAAWMMA